MRSENAGLKPGHSGQAQYQRLLIGVTVKLRMTSIVGNSPNPRGDANKFNGL